MLRASARFPHFIKLSKPLPSVTTKLQMSRTGLDEKKNEGSIKKLLSLLKPEKYSFAAAVGLLGVSTAVTLSVPLCVQKTVDAIFKTDSVSLLGVFQDVSFEQICIGFATLFAIGAVANTGRIWFIQSASNRIVYNLRLDVYKSLLMRDMYFFDKTTSGELVNRLSSDCQLVGDVLTQNVSDILRSFGQSVLSIGLMIYVAPDLALRVAAIVPSIMVVAFFAGKFVRRIAKSLQDNLANATAGAEESFSGIKTVKAFGGESQEVTRYLNSLNKILGLGYKSAAVNSLYWSFLGGSGNFALLIVLYSGYQLSTSGSITPGTLTAFLLYTVYSGIGVTGLGRGYSAVMSGVGASHRLFQLIENAPPQDTRPAIPTNAFAGDISLKDVVFRYPSRPDKVILNGLTETFLRSETTALVGTSGCGKSTIAWLLAGLYYCENGSIRIGDHDVKDVPTVQIPYHVAIVTQDPQLFTTSIYDNIAYGLGDFSEKEVMDAAEIAMVTEFAGKFENKLLTEVGSKGGSLSGGQKQRVALARALIRKPNILILDEATSALDSATEKKVIENLSKLTDCTVVLIAHRLSTIVNADKIIVLDNGRVKEVGTYNSLLSSDGVFSDLVRLQDNQNA